MSVVMENFTIPAQGATEQTKLKWLSHALQVSREFVETQPSFRQALAARDRLSNAKQDPNTTDIKFIGKLAREVVATLANVRPRSSFSSDNPKFAPYAEALDKCHKARWNSTFVDRKIKEVVQHALTGRGFISPTWEPNFWGPGKGEIGLNVHGVEDVFPFLCPKDGDIQRAYATFIRNEVPVNDAWAAWPDRQRDIVPDRVSATWLGKVKAVASKYLSPLLRSVNKPKGLEQSFPSVDIFYAYVRDGAVNTTGDYVQMGTEGAVWSYRVPSLGQMIPLRANDASGNPLYREATERDALLYPNRRLIIFTATAVLYDGPSFWWHGKVPLVEFDFYKWSWDYMSTTVVQELLPIESLYNRMTTSIAELAEVRLDPPLQYDNTAHTPAEMKALNLRKRGARIGVNMSLGETIKTLMSPDFYNPPQWVITFTEKLPQFAKDFIGLPNMEAIVKAGQMPATDTVDKILASNGAIITDHAREMERSLFKLAMMTRDLFFEFYTTARRFQLFGSDGLTPQDFDYEPGLMIPDRMEGEPEGSPSQYSMAERARHYLHNFTFSIVPNSVYQVTDMQRQMLMLQLWRDGRFPMDPRTVAEALNIPNFGKDIDGTVIERWMQFQKLTMDLQQALQADAQQAQQQQVLGALMSQLMGGQERAGRPSSGQAPPRMEERSDGQGGTRTVISESD